MKVCFDLPNAAQILGDWLYIWQTLISGILAIGAAYWAGRLIKQQIAQADKLHGTELARRHNSVRTVLPIALAAVSDFCAAIVEQIAKVIEALEKSDREKAYEGSQTAEPESIIFTPVAIPSEMIPTISSFVETLDDNDNIRHIAELIGSIQILKSRFESFNFDQVLPIHGLYGLLLDTAKVGALADRVYNYARFVDHQPFGIVDVLCHDDCWDLIHQKSTGLIFHCKVPDIFFKSIADRVQGYKERNISPWLQKFDHDR